MNIIPNWTVAIPEIWLLSAICVVLLVDCFNKNKQSNMTYWLSQIAILGALLFSYQSLSLGEQTYAFGGLFVADDLASWLKILLYVLTAAALVYGRDYIKVRLPSTGEYYLLILCSLLGMMVMVSAAHLLTLYLGLELLSLCLYTLVAIQRESSKGSEAAMKYFVMGAVASGVLLYGISIIYGVTQTFNLQEIALFVTEQTIADDSGAVLSLLAFALIFIIPAIAFKLGAVPFHMWLPDVYQGAPTSVTLFLSTAPKVAAFAMVLRVLIEAVPALHTIWQPLLVIIAIVSMGLGNLIAISQTNLKRMLAYSAIAHMGFFLLGVLSGQGEGFASSLFYITVYALMSMGAFAMIVLMSNNGQELENIDDFKGLNERRPWYAFLMLLLMFSMAGVPPTIGFYAKLSVLKSVVAIDMAWLAGVAVFFSIIGAYYYLRVVKVMYFDKADTSVSIPIKASSPAVAVLLGANGLAILALGLYPTGLMALCLQLLA